MKKIIALILSMLLSACMVGPNYVRPKIAVPTQYKEAAPKGWKVAEPRDAFDRGDWWTFFHDPKLNALEEQLMNSNQTVANAAATYDQARALVDEARASLFPTLAGSASLTRQRQVSGSSASVNTSSGFVNSGGGGSSKVFTTHSWLLDASWEPDLWGNLRRAVTAAKDTAQADNAQLANVRLLSTATLAQTYFQLRAADMDQKLLDDTVIEYQKTLQLTRNRYASGVAARTDVITAQSQLENAQSLAINNHIGRAQFEHAIAVLLGEAPAFFSIPPTPLHATPPTVPLAVPSDLLERRPDVANAERLAASANEQIGIAIAAYFPTLPLSATASYQAKNYAHWFSIPLTNWSLGAQLADTIVDGGLRSATIAAARANYLATVATYKQTILAAFQDVEDNLASQHYLKDQTNVANKAAADARFALTLIINQYKAGTVAYTDVITAQNTAYTAEKTAADLNGQRMVAAVGLIKALGGGWDGVV